MEWKFVNSLFKNDLIQYFLDANNLENFIICRVVKFSDPEIALQPHNSTGEHKIKKIQDGEGADGKEEVLNKNIRKQIHLLKFRKIHIDTLGNIFPAND